MEYLLHLQNRLQFNNNSILNQQIKSIIDI